MEISQDVHKHRKKAEKKLPPKAKDVLERLQGEFGEYFPKVQPCATFKSILQQGDDETLQQYVFGSVGSGSLDKVLIWTSTLVLGIFLVVLQCRLDWTAAHEERVPSYLSWRRRGMNRYVYAGIWGLLSAFVAARHWFRLTSAIVGITRRFKRLPERMLLFSFLATTSAQIEMRGDESWEALENIRKYMEERREKSLKNDQEKTHLQDFPKSSQDDREKTDLQDLPKSAQNDQEKTDLQDLPKSAQDDQEKTHLQDLPKSAQDDQEKTNPQDLPKSAQDDQEKTNPQDLPKSAQDDQEKTDLQDLLYETLGLEKEKRLNLGKRSDIQAGSHVFALRAPGPGATAEQKLFYDPGIHGNMTHAPSRHAASE